MAKRLRQLMQAPGPILAPGIYDCISAKVVERAGYDAAFVSGAAVTASVLGYPDVGLQTMPEILAQVRNMARAVEIPLIVAPGVSKRGSVVPTPVSHLDIFPTLAELCGVKAPANLHGQSLVAMLRDSSTIGRGWALTQVQRGGGAAAAAITREAGTTGRRFFGYSLRTARWRYTEWAEGAHGRELYDHNADPQELTNLSSVEAHAKMMAELSQQLRRAVKTTYPPSGETPPVKEGLWMPMLVAP